MILQQPVTRTWQRKPAQHAHTRMLIFKHTYTSRASAGVFVCITSTHGDLRGNYKIYNVFVMVSRPYRDIDCTQTIN